MTKTELKNLFKAYCEENGLDISSCDLDENFDKIVILANSFKNSHDLPDEELILGLFFPDSFQFNGYYKFDDEKETSSSYYRTLNKDKFIKEFKDVFQKNTQERFKEALDIVEETYPEPVNLLKDPSITGGFTLGVCHIKRMMNTKNAEGARDVTEFRLSTSGALPTMYNCINGQEGFIFLGTCHMKNNGNRGEDSYIQKASDNYNLFLNLEEKALPEYCINISKEL